MPFLALFLSVFDQRQGLLDEVIAFTKLIYRVMDQVAANIIEAVREVVQFFGVMAVVIQHVLQKSKGFFR